MSRSGPNKFNIVHFIDMCDVRQLLSLAWRELQWLPRPLTIFARRMPIANSRLLSIRMDSVDHAHDVRIIEQPTTYRRISLDDQPVPLVIHRLYRNVYSRFSHVHTSESHIHRLTLMSFYTYTHSEYRSRVQGIQYTCNRELCNMYNDFNFYISTVNATMLRSFYTCWTVFDEGKIVRYKLLIHEVLTYVCQWHCIVNIYKTLVFLLHGIVILF